jgi:hypothetical protein
MNGKPALNSHTFLVEPRTAPAAQHELAREAEN